ncbi:MAG: hypothetical protein HUJ61_05975 [Bacilli bacterium]|nr:hypothetical protein [Bacilli bacterium]
MKKDTIEKEKLKNKTKRIIAYIFFGFSLVAFTFMGISLVNNYRYNQELQETMEQALIEHEQDDIINDDSDYYETLVLDDTIVGPNEGSVVISFD